MARFNIDDCVCTINGYRITEFAEGGDALVGQEAPLGNLAKGVGKAVFVGSGDKTGRITLKLLQHSKANEVLNNLKKIQKQSLKSFTPLEFYFKDLINGDEVVAHVGYFAEVPAFSRGTDHNPTTWVMDFENYKESLKEGS